tara:strand:- start:3681 stop:3974 length:294 start_codon:yes stop_codon:yes gene_type:complete
MTLEPSASNRLYYALEHYDREDPASVIISSLVVGVIAINLVAIILESIPAYAAAYGGPSSSLNWLPAFFSWPSIFCVSGYASKRRRNGAHRPGIKRG